MTTNKTNSVNNQIMQLAVGRIFRLLSRPFQEGDYEQYEAARRAFYAARDAEGIASVPDTRPNYARTCAGERK